MITSICDNCGNIKRFHDDKQGKKYKCPNCGSIVKIDNPVKQNYYKGSKEVNNDIKSKNKNLEKTGIGVNFGDIEKIITVIDTFNKNEANRFILLSDSFLTTSKSWSRYKNSYKKSSEKLVSAGQVLIESLSQLSNTLSQFDDWSHSFNNERKNIYNLTNQLGKIVKKYTDSFEKIITSLGDMFEFSKQEINNNIDVLKNFRAELSDSGYQLEHDCDEFLTFSKEIKNFTKNFQSDFDDFIKELAENDNVINNEFRIEFVETLNENSSELKETLHHFKEIHSTIKDRVNTFEQIKNKILGKGSQNEKDVIIETSENSLREDINEIGNEFKSIGNELKNIFKESKENASIKKSLDDSNFSPKKTLKGLFNNIRKGLKDN